MDCHFLREGFEAVAEVRGRRGEADDDLADGGLAMPYELGALQANVEQVAKERGFSMEEAVAYLLSLGLLAHRQRQSSIAVQRKRREDATRV